LAPEDTVDGLKVHRAPMVGVRRYFMPLLDQAALNGYDVLHVHGIDGFFEHVARRPRRHGQIRVATTHGAIFHTKWLAPLKSLYFNTVSRSVARNYDLICANSAADKSLFDNVGAPVALIPNGVKAIGDFWARGQDILTIGRLAGHKRVERLISALAAPPLRDRACVLHVVGPDWDVRAKVLADHARALGVADRVVFHGHVDDAERARIARQCGVFVSASEYEGFGMTLIEAMSVGLAPVVQPNASFRELVNASGVGTLCDFSRADEAAKAIARALDMATMSARARARNFAATLSWNRHAARTLELYEKALRGPELRGADVQKTA
jgi:alpha-1,3-mannosyltransferase